MRNTKKAPHSPTRHAIQSPLTTEELLEKDNELASEAMPLELSYHLKSRRLLVSGLKEPPKATKVERAYAKNISALQWHLPDNAVIGLPGQTLTLHSTKSSKSAAPHLRDGAKPHRPRWVDHIYHPKRAIAPPWARGPVSGPGSRREVFYGVFGTDDRSVYYPTGYPWQCVGKIYAWKDATAGSPSWSGSGVLIGSRLVLTAGHVVPWDAKTWMMRFVPAYYDGSSVLGVSAESYVSDAHGWDVSYKSRSPNPFDMAILRLYDPLGDWLGYFGSKPYWKGYQDMKYFNLTGYPGAVAGGERPSYQPGIEVLDAEATSSALDIEHQGDSTAGDSGAPFWATWPDGFPYAIGTVSGGEILWDSHGTVIEDNNNVAGGQALNDLIRWGRTNWPA